MTEIVTLNRLWFDTYWPSFRLHVHELLAWGYEDAISKIGQEHEEEEITGFISEAIQERLISSDCPRWCERYSLKEDNPVPGKGLTGKRRKVPDFIFELTIAPRPWYIFEAKRLRLDKNFREGYYFGKGLERFLREEYASKYLEAGMIGYVQCDTLDNWMGRLKQYLDKDTEKKEPKLHLKSYSQDEQVIGTFPKEWVSKHIRETGNEITIYHILLDCASKDALPNTDGRAFGH
ncbi:MAG TPA: hypothetical protein VK553_02780, partial [Candidatus Nitrosopolaris rasttigaisensis]|nr:hypothetical protein [Candidatus Nitrosopolaris rasttigaisensis]